MIASSFDELRFESMILSELLGFHDSTGSTVVPEIRNPRSIHDLDFGIGSGMLNDMVNWGIKSLFLI